ncbi:MAG: hypothetical protein COA96_15470 [SAR86 cluster bacterium]|uniref:DUF615 domain-containing protein n=1 Tax=SAR86 cluster bacterium TaxID=2030880 RepID=A0A2A5AQ68_9GAMM|nr:MAG: hypothetical protein COA96_15470 [SAR86 cluster bacterium]
MESQQNIEAEIVSKTQLKQEATDLQKLGKKLTGYSPSFLKKLPIHETLISAIAEFNRLPNSHGARRRQLQFIGKLMRDCDYELINTAIQKLENGTLVKNKPQSELDSWCDRILLTGDAEINKLLDLHPQLERQTLRQLYREHNRAKESTRPKFKNKLQSYLRNLLSN